MSTATGKRKRHQGRQPYSVLSDNGRIRVCRVRWHCPRERSQTVADRLLDETEAVISQGVRETTCRVNQDAASIAKAAENLKRTAHLEVSKETLRQLVEGEGRTVLNATQRGTPLPEWSSTGCTTDEGTTRVYLGCDGSKVPLVTDDEKKKRRRNTRDKRRRRGRKCQPLPRCNPGADSTYKEFKVGYLYDETKQRRSVAATAGNHEAAGHMLRRMSNQVQLGV